MIQNVYQTHISLKNSKPRIWRRLLIPSDLLLSDFNKIIQTSMGWTNSHLHQFIKDNIFYMPKNPDDDLWYEFNNVDYGEIRISELLEYENDKIEYEYDFGDGWMHEIKLEKILPPERNIGLPVCLKGKMNCPPEDCGGLGGFYNMLEILKDPDHEEYESYLEWLGEGYDPEYFNIEEINELLKQDNFGCIEFL